MKRSSTAKSTLMSLICPMLLPALLFSQDAVVKRPSTPSLKKGEKQLFVDELMIKEKQGVTSVVHPAKKLERPVLEAEMPWEVRDKDGFLDKRVNIYGTVLRDDTTGTSRMYYTAVTTPHGGLAPEKQQSIARASWRIDGLASLRTRKKQEPGIIETHEFLPEGSNLRVNADVKNGSLRVEVLDAAGQVIEGYARESSVIRKQDSVKLAIRWKNAKALPAGVPIRLRFHLENGDLFSYLID